MEVLISLKRRNICWDHEILICCWWAKNRLHLQLAQTKGCRAEETNRPQFSPELHLHCSTMAKRGDSSCWPSLTLSLHRNYNKKCCNRALLSWRLKQPGQNSPRNTTAGTQLYTSVPFKQEWPLHRCLWFLWSNSAHPRAPRCSVQAVCPQLWVPLRFGLLVRVMTATCSSKEVLPCDLELFNCHHSQSLSSPTLHLP